jgi:hypothetical protein
MRGVLASFKKDMRPGLDGWTTGFFLGFYVLVEEDLLGAIEEVKKTNA